MFQVFIRNWYRSDGRGGRVPGPGRKTIWGYVNTEEEARAICREYNDNNEPGLLSRKAEYSSSY